MDSSLLCTLEEPFQIMAAIEKGAQYGGDMWQVSELGRQVFPVVKIQPDIRSNQIIFRFFNLSNLDRTSPLFIRLCYRNLIFRLDPDGYKINGDRITCLYPQAARALDERHNDRYALPFDSYTSLSLRRAVRTLRDLGKDLEVRILDVSEKGFGLMISGMNRDFLHKHDQIWIKSVDQQPLDSHILAQVTYVAPKGENLKRGDVRVGIHLEKPLVYDIFEQLKRKSHIILTG